ncbi:sensor histidine kinase [Sphingomonas sp. Leaf357]|uniref:sensor histidine kinase n=1 Tax=Sphingomonas sp. Leaf357 TaxID=1736350 RepID=UPI000B15F28E|nr:histidine kinase dimerization/phosphoacceptor domain -containing protein [Sphingomonas sp. Leaf357]
MNDHSVTGQPAETRPLSGTVGNIPLRSSLFVAAIPTGAKVFLILSAALLPLAVIAFFATLNTAQNATADARARVRVASSETARRLAIEMIGDMTALRVALNALDSDAGDAPSCARAQGVFAQQAASGTRFAIIDANRRVLCGTALPSDLTLLAAPGTAQIAARVVPGKGVVLAIGGNRSGASANAFFPARFLADIGQPSGFPIPFETRLAQGDVELTLTPLPDRATLERRETQRIALGLGDLDLEMTIRSQPITPPVLIALLFPILMWFAAASIGWFIVDRLLIRPLRRLRTAVAAYVPGEEIDPEEVRALPAQEIRELGDTFRNISRTVATHEAGLAEGLVRQTKLTREVHHRVKNNLQVISSLINFHARSAKSVEASAAYAGIQRRVDALAVVHRHHFAEMEEHRGLSLRSVIGELASNIRATAPDNSSGLGILLDVEPWLVNQDIGIAVAFLITEIVELAMSCNPAAQIRISVKPGETEERAVLRISSPSLIDCDALQGAIKDRYGRVMEGLSRQLRSKLHHDPLIGAYEITIAVIGRD